MKNIEEITNVTELQEWITAHNNFSTCDVEENAFTVLCPQDLGLTIHFESDEDIDTIIDRTIEVFEDFDADDEFTELWCQEFAEHNHFTPSTCAATTGIRTVRIVIPGYVAGLFAACRFCVEEINFISGNQ
jgi:hypothetical protein